MTTGGPPTLPTTRPGSPRAIALAARVREAADALIALVDGIDPDAWSRVPTPGVWSVGKEAEHAAEGIALHMWVIRKSLGERVPSKHPPVERKQMASALSPREAADLLRHRADDALRVVQALADEQLDLPRRPPSTRPRTVADEVGGTLVGHLNHHRAAIEAKLNPPPSRRR